MISISPVGATAVDDQVSLLLTIREKIRPFCVGSTIQPQVSIVYVNETPFLRDTTVFVPIQAIVTIVTPGNNGKATTQLFTERFIAAFQGQTAVPSTVTIQSVGRIQGPSDITCCKAATYSINDSITVTIA